MSPTDPATHTSLNSQLYFLGRLVLLENNAKLAEEKLRELIEYLSVT